jgi:hypothetical protein
MRITRKWAMPSADTFSIPPIGEFVKSYLRNSKISVDHFARNCGWATYTNDLNFETSAKCHMKAFDFLTKLANDGVRADLIIFDPPYSLRQVKEVYDEFGKFTFEDSKDAGKWTREKKLSYDLLIPGGIFLYFGWNTNGLGLQNGARIIEILIVSHGGSHNDTLCMAEIKEAHQPELEKG